MQEQEIVALLKKLISSEKSVGFMQLCDDYLKIYARKQKKSVGKDMRYIESYLLPAFGNKPIKSIGVVDIQRLHSKISEKTPTTANRVVEVLSKMFSLATQWGYYDERNPCASVTHNSERSRERFLTDDEVRRVLVALERESLEVKCLVYMYILTGRRKEELRSLRWEHVDFTEKTMKIYDSKKSQTIYIPIPTLALTLLQELTPTGVYVFAKNHQKVGLERQWRRIRQRAGIVDVTIHDLRRTCATWMFSDGETLDTIRELLNHSSTKTTKIYAKLKRDKIAGAMERLSNKVSQFAPAPKN